MSTTATIPDDTRCTRLLNHEEDHSTETILHKCLGPECTWCQPRCEWVKMIVEVWVEKENQE